MVRLSRSKPRDSEAALGAGTRRARAVAGHRPERRQVSKAENCACAAGLDWDAVEALDETGSSSALWRRQALARTDAAVA